MDLGEDLDAAAVREVWEETRVETEYQSILGMALRYIHICGYTSVHTDSVHWLCICVRTLLCVLQSVYTYLFYYNQ